MSRMSKLSTQSSLLDQPHSYQVTWTKSRGLHRWARPWPEKGAVLLEVTQGTTDEWWRRETLNPSRKATAKYLNRDLLRVNSATR